MSDYTEKQFNEAMQEFVSFTVYPGFDEKYYTIDDIEWEPYSDLNQLMPLAFKYLLEFGWIRDSEDSNPQLHVYPNIVIPADNDEGYIDSFFNDDPIQAIRDCLWAINQQKVSHE